MEPSPVLYSPIRRLLAVVEKEFRSEFRQRVGLALTFLSVVSVSFILALSLQGVELSGELFAALLWLAFFFVLSPTLSRSFIAEAERGTYVLLRSLTSAAALYWGKLIANSLFGIVASITSYALLASFLRTPPIANAAGLVILLLVAAFGFAAALTLLSALLAAAQHRGMLLPIVALPILIPILLFGINGTLAALRDPTWEGIMPPLRLLIAYGGILSVLGFWLSEWVWQE
ncbi:MAG: heme exporter protein CcmB [Candidatus Kapabacteria bacterium]|nr:heme exporter protein CcmB [Candidatus Kapabacteria bacterium]MDW8011824.1 heme exporter protein CcmB [Bacteroidota bacterium]